MLQREREFMLFGLSPPRHSWRGIKLLIGIYLGAMLFAAIAAPPIYWIILAWYENAPNSLNTYLAHKGFEDYFDRLRWIPVILGLPWMLIQCRLWSLAQLGVSWDFTQTKRFIRYFIIGCVLIITLAAAQLLFSPTHLKTDLTLGYIFTLVTKATLGALLLGLLEEIVFRGLILRIFYTALSPIIAVTIASLFFAYVHFKMPDSVWEDAFPQTTVNAEAASASDNTLEEAPPPDAARVSWSSGFFVAWWTLVGISVDFELLRFVNLCLLGIILGLLTLRTRSLMPAIGLHAGIVWIMLIYRKIAEINTGSLILGGNQLTDGLLPLLILSLIAIRLILQTNKRSLRYDL